MKKTHSIKRFLAILLTLVLFTVPFSLPVQAAGIPSGVSAAEAEMDEAVTSIMNALSQAPDSFGFTKEQLAKSHIGAPVRLHSEQAETPEHYTVYYPIVCGDIVIGIVTVLSDNGVLYPSVAIDFAYQLNNLKNKEAAYTLYNYNGKLYAVSQTETLCISENRAADPAELPAALTQRNAQSALSFAELTKPNPSITFNSPVAFLAAPEDYAVRLLDVKGLPQIDYNGTVQNICWAASLASVLNYEFPDVMIATAADVAEATGIGYRTASTNEIKAGLQTMMSWMKNIFGAELTATIKSRPLAMVEIMREIGTTSAGHPFSMSCDATVGTIGHMVTAYGYIRGIDDFIAIMDSNTPRVVRSDGKEDKYEEFSPSELLNGVSDDGYPIIFSRLVKIVNSTVKFPQVIDEEKQEEIGTEFVWKRTLCFTKQAL